LSKNGPQFLTGPQIQHFIIYNKNKIDFVSITNK
jgi:hypothetical protein